MMIDIKSVVIRPEVLAALDYIAKIDPELYRQMNEFDWSIYASAAEITGVHPGINAWASSYSAAVAFSKDDSGNSVSAVAVYPQNIFMERLNYGVAAVPFWAAILVHEYRHLLPGGDGNERPSAELAHEFALKTGDAPLINYTRKQRDSINEYGRWAWLG